MDGRHNLRKKAVDDLFQLLKQNMVDGQCKAGALN